MHNDQIKKWKWTLSYQRECEWLEEMATQGYFLVNITMGIRYTFSKGEPKRMCYDIDRFSLPAKPTLEEIHHKEMFLEIAEELGWKEITHDETQTYYFAKEYVEGDVNELHNDKESRLCRAKKFSAFFQKESKSLLSVGLLVAIMNLLLKCIGMITDENPAKWFDGFTLIYTIFVLGYYKFTMNLSDRIEKELSLTRNEWKMSTDKSTTKTEWKFILTLRGLKRYLEKQLEKGWVLTGVTPFSYFFKKSEHTNYVYTVDSKTLTTKRWKEKQKYFSDKKDWYGLNYDWQEQSVKDAEERGWTFVCALENRSVIYCGEQEKVTQLNDARYDRSLRGTSLVGTYGMFLLGCALVGGLLGFLFGLLTL